MHFLTGSQRQSSSRKGLKDQSDETMVTEVEGYTDVVHPQDPV
jgi:hypothetical protein